MIETNRFGDFVVSEEMAPTLEKLEKAEKVWVQGKTAANAPGFKRARTDNATSSGNDQAAAFGHKRGRFNNRPYNRTRNYNRSV